MSKRKLGSIRCPICESETFLISKPRFQGFQKVGELAYCSGCGHEFEDEERPPILREKKAHEGILGEREVKPIPQFLGAKKDLQFCLYCKEYVEHPFTQRCMRHQREVEATDTCPDFSRKK